MTRSARELADWLDDLQLSEQLAAAGLPTFERDAHGEVAWRDPHTGAPLDPTQLTDLDRLLHSDGDDPSRAVPIGLVQLRRLAMVRQRLLASACFDYESLARHRGTSINATRYAVHKAAQEHALLIVTVGDGVVVPAFQLTDAGELRPELGPVLNPLLASGMDPWRIWGWLCEPAALLGGLVPTEAAGDPEQVEVVIAAAQALGRTSTSGPSAQPSAKGR